MSPELQHYLVEDERTLQATFTGSICEQVGLHLLQAGQQRAAGTGRQQRGGEGLNSTLIVIVE